jgi:sulfite reductase (NADPH) hemoprotein beta-component
LVDKIVKEVNPDISITTYQDILFSDISPDSKKEIERILSESGYGNYSKLRLITQACVGLYTCSIAVAESEKYFHPLLNELEASGYGNVEGVSLGISGCERHCSRNVRHDISIEGKGMDLYQVKLLLGDIKNNVANDLINDGKKYLRCVPKNQIPDVIKALIDNYTRNRLPGEITMSLFHERIGVCAVLDYLKNNTTTTKIMEKTYDAALL